MTDHHKIYSFTIGFLYSFVLFRFSLGQPVFRFMVPALFIFLTAVYFYNKNYLIKISKQNIWTLAASLLLFLGAFGVFLFLPTEFLRVSFLLCSAVSIGFFEMHLGNFGENLLVNQTLLSAFGIFIGFAGAEQNFPGLKQILWHLGQREILRLNFSMQPLYLIGCFIFTLLLCRSFYEFIPYSERTKWVSSIIISLFSLELFWALSFLPIHFSAKAVLLLSLYYFCLILNYYNFFHTLTQKKVQFHLALIVLAGLLVILATPWKVIV